MRVEIRNGIVFILGDNLSVREAPKAKQDVLKRKAKFVQVLQYMNSCDETTAQLREDVIYDISKAEIWTAPL